MFSKRITFSIFNVTHKFTLHYLCNYESAVIPFMSKSILNQREYIHVNSKLSYSSNQEDLGTNMEERKALEKWLEMCKFEGEYIPQTITEEQFSNLLDLKGTFQRRKYLRFLFKKEVAAENDKIRKQKIKERKTKEREERQLENDGHIKYGLWKNSMFAKTSDVNVINFYHHRLVSSHIHGQPLVLDLGFDGHMKGREISSLAEQLLLSISLNRGSHDPFNLTMCNTNLNTKSMQAFIKRMPNVTSDVFPMNITSSNYMDLYPKEKLVYLTPHCRKEMKAFDHDAIYIIGGIVDLGNDDPLTLAKAKKQRIRMEKFPLDRYHIFKHNKSLGLHVVLAILLDLRDTGDWKEAFENIPKRLLHSASDKPNRWDMRRVLS